MLKTRMKGVIDDPARTPKINDYDLKIKRLPKHPQQLD